MLKIILLSLATLAVLLNASPIKKGDAEKSSSDQPTTQLDADLLKVYMDYLESFGFKADHHAKKVELKRYQGRYAVNNNKDSDEEDDEEVYERTQLSGRFKTLRPFGDDPDEEDQPLLDEFDQNESETELQDEEGVDEEKRIFQGSSADQEEEEYDESYSLFEINFKIDNMTRYFDIFKQIKAKADLEVNELDIFNYLTRPSEYYQMHAEQLNETVYYEIFYNQSFDKLIDYMKYYALNEQAMLNQTKTYMNSLNYTIENYANLTNATDQNGFPVLRNSREELRGLYQFIRGYYDDKLVELNLAQQALDLYEKDGNKEAYYFSYLERIMRFRKRLNTFLEIVRFLLYETRITLDKIELSMSKESRGLDYARSKLSRRDFYEEKSRFMQTIYRYLAAERIFVEMLDAKVLVIKVLNQIPIKVYYK